MEAIFTGWICLVGALALAMLVIFAMAGANDDEEE